MGINLRNEEFKFGIVDYLVFCAMLVLSAITGIYYGCNRCKCFGKMETRARSLAEYLSGSKNMKPFPVAMSLVASYVSGVTVLGTPAEIYNFGSQYCIIGIAIWTSGLIVATVYMPVFFKLQLNSSYEYLELRFNRLVRIFASVIFVMDEIFFLPIVIYVPSLALNQGSLFSTFLVIIVIVVNIVVMLLGGIKAVIWTDTWQIVIMFISVVVIVILGTVTIGGVTVVWNRSVEGGRISFLNLSTSLYERHTVISVIIGGTMYWTSFNAVNQTMVQRYLSLPTKRKAAISILYFTIGISAFVSICCFAGLLIYATYFNCDPSESGRINADDQLFPLFVMEIVGHLPGVPGMFVAGVCGAALSSLSVILNSTSAVVLEDFLRSCFKVELSEKHATLFVKFVALALGGISLGFLFVIDKLGGILAMSGALTSIAAGTTFGVFSLGMLIPWANSKGALAGGISGAIVSGIISFGIQYVNGAGLVVPHKIPGSVEACETIYGIKINNTMKRYPDESNIFPLFRLSYHYITPIAVMTVMSVGTVVSFLTGKTDLRLLDPDLISPVIHRFLPKKSDVAMRAHYSKENGVKNEKVGLFNMQHFDEVTTAKNSLLGEKVDESQEASEKKHKVSEEEDQV
ncbi:sodium-coupled monocarboxylate transporter 1-like [Agrilus planipennis]|uniref:Sodium-coupled monocarboxylate transporter 1-like n=1 Tax=Agrilus planipennis TaxID=224129 RepID=A0A7F5R2L1_AGRPL|nr:sodium-coupled monocarboxylate transporter 1-like [Agrilus planipennis]